jgi:dsRNA-specific ribonuclease
VWLRGDKLGQGKGRSIKAAEQAAAKVAFLALDTQENLNRVGTPVLLTIDDLA